MFAGTFFISAAVEASSVWRYTAVPMPSPIGRCNSQAKTSISIDLTSDCASLGLDGGIAGLCFNRAICASSFKKSALVRHSPPATEPPAGAVNEQSFSWACLLAGFFSDIRLAGSVSKATFRAIQNLLAEVGNPHLILRHAMGDSNKCVMPNHFGYSPQRSNRLGFVYHAASGSGLGPQVGHPFISPRGSVTVRVCWRYHVGE